MDWIISSITCWFFFCKKKTAYEMRISYWSSDVCSSDLPPNAFAGTIPHCQTVGVVDFRAPVDGGLLEGFGKPEHRRCRRDAEPRDIAAQEQRAVDVHHHAAGALHVEAEHAGQARPIEQGMDRHAIAAPGRWGEPEVRE